MQTKKVFILAWLMLSVTGGFIMAQVDGSTENTSAAIEQLQSDNDIA